MSVVNIYTIDDTIRPADSSGNPIEQATNLLRVTINGKTFDWYLGLRFIFTEDSSTPNYYYIISNDLIGINTTLSDSAISIRAVIQASTNNFSSNFHTNTTNTFLRYTNQGLDKSQEIWARDGITEDGNFSNAKSISHYYPNNSAFYNNSTSSNTLNISNRAFKIRIKLQYQNSGGTWVDCTRANGSVWKTYSCYAPFYQTITPPTHVYGNTVNRFTAPISADFKYAFKNNSGYKSCFPAVRNINPPYITEGEATDYLYWFPGVSKYYASNDQYKNFKFIVTLSIKDPNDTDYYYVVARRQVSVEMEYQESDDFSMYDTPTWSVSDLNNTYRDYGVLLRNIATEYTINVTATSRYGAERKPYAYKIEGSSSDYTLMNFDNSIGEGSITLPMPSKSSYSGTVGHLGVQVQSIYPWYEGIYFNERINVPIIDYYLPSIPIFNIHRCDQDGTANDKGSYCKIDWSVAVNPINNLNSKKLVISHPSGTTTYEPLDNYNQSGSLIVEANTELSYTISITLSDDFNTVTRTTKLSTANVIMDWLYNGHGVGFGKVASKENTVEIAEEWKLLAYQMWINDIDVGALLKKLFSRILTLEQFATQTGQTTQFVVTFYNDSEWLNRQWVRSGQDATDPRELSQSWQRISTPERTPTETEVYSFVGWAKTNTATEADSTALKTITANRTIYAVFATSTRKYTVRWLNDYYTTLETDSNLNYLSSAYYNGTEPTKEGYTFVGWMPSGYRITKDTDAMAQFFDESEITDSWEDIMLAVATGTARTKYKPGQYKELDCGEFGKTVVRIKGFKLNRLSGSNNTATIAWEGVDCLNVKKRMNPALEATTYTETYNDWVFYDYTSGSSRYMFKSQFGTARTQTYPGWITATVTCKGSGTFKIQYGRGNYQQTTTAEKLVITVNGEEKYNQYLPLDYSTHDIDLPCVANDVFTIRMAFSSSSFGTVVQTYLNWANVTNGVTISYTLSKRKKAFPDVYTENTGCLGGWKNSELRQWMNNTFYNAIDPVVRNHIKPTIRVSSSTKIDNSEISRCVYVDNEETIDKICIPGYSELYGNTEHETDSTDFKYKSMSTTNPYISKKINGSTSNAAYWTRSAWAPDRSAYWHELDEEYVSNFIRTPYAFSCINATGEAESQRYVCICFDT